MSDNTNSKIPGLLRESSQLIQKLAADNESLMDENEALRKEVRVIKLAARMEDLGVDPTLSLEEKVASLGSMSERSLMGIEAATELNMPGFSLGSLKASDETSTPSASASADALDNFVLSGRAYD